MKIEEQLRVESTSIDPNFHAVEFFPCHQEAYAKELWGKSFEEQRRPMKLYASGERMVGSI